MKSLHLKRAFIICMSSCIFFCIIFAMPFLSQYVAKKITVYAGCTSGDFVVPPQCAPGIINDRFAPLAGWLNTFLAPLFFVNIFWDWLLIWQAISFSLWVWWMLLERREQREADYRPFGQ